MSTLSRRETLLALSTLSLTLSACDTAERLVGGDPLVKPKSVGAGALRRAAQGDRLRAFYEARRWRPAWTPQASNELQAAFGDLPRHGIEPARFDRLIKARDAARREVELTSTAMAYGDALAHGLAKPATLFPVFALDRNDASVDQGLERALSSGELSSWIEGLAPADPEYKVLSKAYLDYRERADGPMPAALPEGKAVMPGQNDARIPQLVLLLDALGYSLTPAAAAGPLYGPSIVEAVKAFQNDNGINDDGVLGADTLAALNAGPADRARQIALNLEARRWLSRAVPPTRIDVNSACAFQTYFRDGRALDSRRVVAGKPGAETPNLSGAFSQVVVNPPWNVPQGIAEKEILPKGPAYLADNDMSIVDGRVVQRPGPKAALGQVKFDMQNPYAIYLHDTPSKQRFSDNERHFSHGCVRVSDAVGFARLLAKERGKTSEFDEKLATGKTATVDLGAETPVRLLYHTVFVDPQGRVGFRPDVYGWDAALAAALGMDPPLRRGLAGSAAMSVGP